MENQKIEALAHINLESIYNLASHRVVGKTDNEVILDSLKLNGLMCSYSLQPNGHWYILEARVQTATTTLRQKSFITTILNDSIPLPAIVVSQTGSDLLLSGATNIQGQVILNEGSLKEITHKGRGYTGKNNAQVQEMRSASELNDSTTTQLIEHQIHPPNLSFTKEFEPPKLSSGNIITAHTFETASSHYFSDGITLNNCTGKYITIIADGPIVIENNSVISGQFISTSFVKIDSSKVEHPSFIRVYDSDSDSLLILENSAKLRGFSQMISVRDSTSQSTLAIDSTSSVTGIIITDGDTRLSGTIHGTILTSRFFMRDGSTDYFNRLIDVSILRDERPSLFYAPFYLLTNKSVGFYRSEVVKSNI